MLRSEEVLIQRRMVRASRILTVNDARRSSAPDSEATPIGVVARGLVKSFDGGLVHALRGVDLDVQPGERVAITGPTGCGKSTLLSVLALLERPDAGELRVGETPATRVRTPELWRAEHVGIVFQFHHLLLHLTVEENLMLAAVAGVARASIARCAARAVLREVGLGHRAESLARTLSGGERQLTAVARALVGSPSLILADEPTGNVDSETGRRVLELLYRGSDSRSCTVILVTHDDRVARTADRIVRMRDGRIDDLS